VTAKNIGSQKPYSDRGGKKKIRVGEIEQKKVERVNQIVFSWMELTLIEGGLNEIRKGGEDQLNQLGQAGESLLLKKKTDGGVKSQ